MNFNEILFKFAVGQHQRRRDGRFNIAFLINVFKGDYMDFCMEAWIVHALENKKK
tara:strand:- start:460 stop:624 length:165 start_codon:yes stop_codon:yes gene_type:complete